MHEPLLWEAPACPGTGAHELGVRLLTPGRGVRSTPLVPFHGTSISLAPAQEIDEFEGDAVGVSTGGQILQGGGGRPGGNVAGVVEPQMTKPPKLTE